MKRSQREAAARGSTHLSRLSLPAVRSNGSFEGSDILAEAGAVPAILLCQVYRGVMGWALTPAAEHPGLFPPGAAAETRRLMREAPVPDELRPALETVCGLFDDPAGADPRGVAEACMRIGEWAERKGDAPATALRFVQAGASCSPNDPRLAYRAGYVARQRASWDLAELWFRHSSTVGRRAHDWEAHARAYSGLGNSYYRQGRYLPAQREHLKALRVAKRHGIRDLQGNAYHDLFGVAIGLQNAEKAEEFGKSAFNAYGAGHRMIPALAHDIAYFWITRGQFHRALPVFQALLPHFQQPENRLRVLATLARAAGGAQERQAFHGAWAEAWSMAAELEQSTALTTSLLEMAYGAVSLAEWALASEAAGQASSRARERGEVDVLVPAEELLARISDARTETQVVSDVSTVVQVDQFAADLVSSLRETAGVG
ncbi:MAG TPA: tetratricopeptide repeat protein [Longimicrobiaceae bacterium]|jgi:tetratricopeptide (TPR) repeat protein